MDREKRSHLKRNHVKILCGLQVPEVQLLEPALGLFDAGNFQGLYESTYATLSKSVSINLVTFYDDVGDCFEWVSKLPVKAVSLDFCGVVRVQTFQNTCQAHH